MIKLITSSNLVGQELRLTSDDIENYDEVVSAIGDDVSHSLSLKHDGKIINGEIMMYQDEGTNEDMFAVVFDRSVILPDGVCIYVNVECEKQPDVKCYPKLKAKEISKSTRLLVVDTKGCPKGYITISELLKLVETPSLCDVLGDKGIPAGELVTSDSILTVSGKCDLKAVPQSDIACK